jgi:hypothetical protein
MELKGIQIMSSVSTQILVILQSVRKERNLWSESHADSVENLSLNKVLAVISQENILEKAMGTI